MAATSPSVSNSISAAQSDSARYLKMPALDLGVLLALLGVAAVCVRIIWFTPSDAMLGDAQKIFYIHVPAAIAGLYLACPLMAVSSLGYLWIRDERLDRLAESSAELGLLFMGIVLLTGPIWARTSWGTWWVWEARLTATVFLWLMVLGYLVLRGAVETAESRARLSAVMGSLAVLLVPFVHLTVRLFRGMHPGPVVLKPEAPSLPPEMLKTFLFSNLVFLLLFVVLLRQRYRWAGLRNAVQALEEE